MPRPPKFRRVEFLPVVTVFKPAGVPQRVLEENILTVEELEAVRLKDLEGLEQEDCAVKMQVSRPTFQRILANARMKITDALIGGKSLRIEGGKYHLATRRFRCRNCSGIFDLPAGRGRWGPQIKCPQCDDGEVDEVE